MFHNSPSVFDIRERGSENTEGLTLSDSLRLAKTRVYCWKYYDLQHLCGFLQVWLPVLILVLPLAWDFAQQTTPDQGSSDANAVYRLTRKSFWLLFASFPFFASGIAAILWNMWCFFSDPSGRAPSQAEE